MKHFFLKAYVWLGVFCIGLSTPLCGLDVGITHIVYATPTQPYVEINLEVAGESVAYRLVDSVQAQAAVSVLILIKQGEDVVNYEKYTLRSPLVRHAQSLLDVKRLRVPNGTYTLDITVQDLQAENNRFSYQKPLVVNVPTQLYMTEVQLLRSFRSETGESVFAKNGFYMEALPYAFYDRAATTLNFYAEIYNSQTLPADKSYLVRYFIEEAAAVGSGRMLSAGAQRKRPAPIDAVLVQMDIKGLPSGNYVLTVELRNAVNELLTMHQVPFQRSNPFLQEPVLTDSLVATQFVQQLDSTQLQYSLRAISPLFTSGDDSEMLKNVLKSGEVKAMRFFLFRHFLRQDVNRPEQAYRQYMEVAKAVQERFHSGFRYGFETDRGRMYLRYGKPDDLVHVEDDPNAPPYEIWVYYNFPKTRQKNVKFLFYNPTLAGEDYVLLHSNARGETNNPRWERDLYQRGAGEQYDGDNYHDANTMQRNNNRNARVFFESF